MGRDTWRRHAQTVARSKRVISQACTFFVTYNSLRYSQKRSFASANMRHSTQLAHYTCTAVCTCDLASARTGNPANGVVTSFRASRKCEHRTRTRVRESICLHLLFFAPSEDHHGDQFACNNYSTTCSVKCDNQAAVYIVKETANGLPERFELCGSALRAKLAACLRATLDRHGRSVSTHDAQCQSSGNVSCD